MEDATKKVSVQEVFCKKLQRRQGRPLAERVNVFANAVVDMQTECLNVKLQSVGWHLFEKKRTTWPWSGKNVWWEPLKVNVISLPCEVR